MLFKNSSKTLIAQIVLMSFLGAALFLPVTVADAESLFFCKGRLSQQVLILLLTPQL